MKRVFASAALLATALLASSAAQAQYTFDYGGRTIRVDPDRGTVSIPGVYDNSGRRNRRSNYDRDYDRPRKQAPAQAKVDPQATPPASVDQPTTTAAPANAQPATPDTQANVAPADTSAPAPATAAASPAPSVQQDATPAVPGPVSTPPPPVAATAPTAPAPVQQQQAARTAAPTATPSNSPLGLWLTQEKDGKIRIEQCGANLCGYSVDARSNQNGEQVLINMKPDKDAKWSGRILDPNTGSTYDSTLAMKGSDTLRVQGCAFSGVFCGGQTWTRLN
jgi:uncharacterized protein (DUF2147 family)